MGLHLFPARFDEGLEAEFLAASAVATVVFTHPKLPDGTAQEVESHPTFVDLQCVGDKRLARFQFQSHAFQPGDDDFLTPPDYVPVWV